MRQSWKYVSVGSCVKTIIFSLIAMATLFVPYYINGGTIKFPFSVFPIIGDGTFFEAFALEPVLLVVEHLLGTNYTTYVNLILAYNIQIFYGILIFNIVASLLLIIARFNGLRIFFKIFSIIFAISLIVINLTFLATIVLKIIYYFNVYGMEFTPLWPFILQNGIIYYFVLMIFSLILIFKQFKWFSKP